MAHFVTLKTFVLFVCIIFATAAVAIVASVQSRSNSVLGEGAKKKCEI